MNPTQHTIISTKGYRWSGDFEFYKIYSIRGFKCFLVLVEDSSDHPFLFFRHNKHSPIKLVRWFILRYRLHLGVAFNILRVVNGE